MSKNQRKGIREINQKIKENCVVFKTDKTGQLSIDGKENYRECMEEHIKKDEKVTIKDYEKTEKVLNAHATALSRILGLGTDYGHEGRVTEAVVVLNSHPPDLYGLRKDHKEEKGSLKDSEVVREEIGGAMNPANCLENETDKVGGRVGLENNQKSQLGFQTGGINNPVNSQNKQINSDGGEDDLANSLSESRTRAEIKKKGPKLRPVVGANKASSRPMSHILSRVIYKVSEIIGRKIETNCESTEEMIFEIEEVNQNMKDSEDIIIGSLDIVKWFPSMKVKRLIEITMQLIMEADLNVQEIDIEKLSIYIATSLTREEVEKEYLEEIVPKRKENKRAGITNSNIWLTDGDKCQWEMPQRKPNKTEKQKMFAVGICIGIKLVMENHIYIFGGELRR